MQPTWSYKHEASSDDKLTLPLGIGVSKTIILGTTPLKFSLLATPDMLIDGNTPPPMSTLVQAIPTPRGNGCSGQVIGSIDSTPSLVTAILTGASTTRFSRTCTSAVRSPVSSSISDRCFDRRYG
jgi:hypothetical protein